MKKSLILVSALVIILTFSTRVIAQVNLTGNTAGAELVKVLTITNSVPLHFGVIGITAGTAGTVTMTTAGLRTANAGTTTVISTGTPKTVAKFDLTGTTDDIYTITLPAAIEVTTATGSGDKTMDINALKVKVDNASEVAIGSVGTCTLSSGASSFLVGGTLNISTTQEMGVYAGTYTVSVDYN